jgi:hypothetical protein
MRTLWIFLQKEPDSRPRRGPPDGGAAPAEGYFTSKERDPLAWCSESNFGDFE